jgi:hypothetical protein
MRKVSLLGMLAFTNFATAGLGEAIAGEGGKFSISNLGPVLFTAIAGPCFLAQEKTANRNIIGLFLLFNVCAAASFVLFMFRFGWEPNVAVLGFQDFEFVFVLLLAWYARQSHEEFFAVAKVGILISTAIAGVYGVVQFGNKDVVNIVHFSMDDKSQAAVLFCCWAYILLRFYDGWIARLVAYGLLAMSMMTLSRLPALFLPVFLVTLCVRTRYGFVIAAVTVIGVAAALLTYGDELAQVFTALDRLSSVQQVAGDNATSAHLLLIKSALEMKFSDFEAFCFGTGPGNFSKALTSYPIDIHELESLDPALVADARVGKAPMHSTPISLLLDYNIVIFGILIYLALRAIRYLTRTRHYLDLMFLVTLFAASTFYSLHNKPYFFLAIATVAIGVMGKVRVEEDARGVALAT